MLRASAVCAVSAVGPTVGASGVVFLNASDNRANLDSAALNIAAGSIVLACVAKGISAGVVAPTDNAGNSYTQRGSKNYAVWSSSGTILYAATGVTGGSSVVLRESMAADNNDEATMSVIEVRGGSTLTVATPTEVADNSPGATSPVSSPSLTTSGPAVLVSWWFGNGGGAQQTLSAGNGFTKVHDVDFNDVSAAGTTSSSRIQVGCATRIVTGAGTYSCSWTASTPDQGAILYLAAIEP